MNGGWWHYGWSREEDEWVCTVDDEGDAATVALGDLESMRCKCEAEERVQLGFLMF